MRILNIAYTYYLSDPRVIRACETVSLQGNEVEILCLKRVHETAQENVNNVSIHRLPMQRYRGDSQIVYFANYLLFFVLAFFAIAWKSLLKPYHIIHVHNMPDFLVFTTLIPKLQGCKVILDIHDLMPETFSTKFAEDSFILDVIRLIEKYSIKYADHIITVHEPYGELLKNRDVPDEKISIVMNLPDDKVFYPRPFNRSDTFTMIYHGIVAKRQGIDLVVHALARLVDQGLKIRFLLIGEGDDLPYIRNLAQDLQLEDALELITPFIPTSEIPEKILTAHVGVLPYRLSVATRYMLPVKLMEYVQMGIPVITSKLEIVQFFFEDNMLYYLPSPEVDDLVEAIQKLYSSEQLRMQLAENAKRFTDNYNWHLEGAKLIAAYQKLYKEENGEEN